MTQVLLTRAKEDNEAWGKVLQEAGITFGSIPLIKTKPLLKKSKLLEEFKRISPDFVVFTSPKGAKYFLQGLTKTDIEKMKAIEFCFLGSGTMEGSQDLGLYRSHCANASNGTEFGEWLISNFSLKGKTVLHPVALNHRKEMAMKLERAGARLETLFPYKTESRSLSKEELESFGQYDWIFLGSPSAVMSLSENLGNRLSSSLLKEWKGKFLVIGETTQGHFQDVFGFEASCLESPKVDSLVKRIQGYSKE